MDAKLANRPFLVLLFSGTLAITVERHSAQNSKTKNGWLASLASNTLITVRPHFGTLGKWVKVTFDYELFTNFLVNIFSGGLHVVLTTINKLVHNTTLTEILRRSQSLMQQYLDELKELTRENDLVINSGKTKKIIVFFIRGSYWRLQFTTALYKSRSKSTSSLI